MSVSDKTPAATVPTGAEANVPHLIVRACIGILGAQCSCSSVEPRDRSCVSVPPPWRKLARSLSPAKIWTALITRVVFTTRAGAFA
jgi:hypothetical protein